jgi:hypothetical protein
LSLSTCEIALIGGGFALVGVFLGAWVGYYFSIRLMNRQEFNKLASKFHIALINHSRIIKRSGFIETRADDLDIAFTNTETAFIEFSSLLCDRQRKRINVMWDNYNNKNKTEKEKVKFHAYDLLNSIDKKKLKENLLINIEKLTEFIKQK